VTGLRHDDWRGQRLERTCVEPVGMVVTEDVHSHALKVSASI